ncbi:MAG: tyrosine-type recombinase/integrase, partial [Desulfovibrionaceae bacterium]|nr:tyrosine-type recombinase/integrase [Desulfovibrionaceae bacterium]
MPLFKEWYEADQNLYSCDYIINCKGRYVKSIKRSWQTALKRVGITRRIRPYDLRHAFGTELVAAGVDIGTEAKLMGHSSPTMLLNHYQFVMDKQKRAAVEALPVMARSYGA